MPITVRFRFATEAPVATAGMRPCTPLNAWLVLMKYAGDLEEQPMPLIFTTCVWSRPSSHATVIMRWLMVSWPQPLHSVDGAPLYAAFSRPILFTLMAAGAAAGRAAG